MPILFDHTRTHTHMHTHVHTHSHAHTRTRTYTHALTIFDSADQGLVHLWHDARGRAQLKPGPKLVDREKRRQEQQACLPAVHLHAWSQPAMMRTAKKSQVGRGVGRQTRRAGRQARARVGAGAGAGAGATAPGAGPRAGAGKA